MSADCSHAKEIAGQASVRSGIHAQRLSSFGLRCPPIRPGPAAEPADRISLNPLDHASSGHEEMPRNAVAAFARQHGAVTEWLAQHLRWTFHCTPISCSWIYAVEGFFGKPARRRLRRGACKSVEQLERAILEFIELHNGKEAKGFNWTESPERLIAARQR